MVVAPTVTEPCPTGDDNVAAAGERCIKSVRNHFASRPPATGLATHDFRPSDVIVTTFPKSGTTLMQHLCYQVVALSGGGPSFDPTGLRFPDLAVVSPWLEHIPNVGVAPCESAPRVLKTHLPVARFRPVRSRHIVVVRDPAAYPASWLDFVFDALVPRAAAVGPAVREAAFHACVRADLLAPAAPGDPAGGWHAFVRGSVLPPRPDVLVLFYEDVVADMPAAVRRAAAFMRCPLAEADIAEVVRRCDREAMGTDPRFFCRVENKCFGIGRDLPKACKARSGGFKRFSVLPEHRAQLEDMTERVFGVRTYAELKHMVNARQQELFGH